MYLLFCESPLLTSFTCFLQHTGGKPKCLDFGKQSYITKLNLTSTTIYLSLTPHSLLNVRLQFLLCQEEDPASIEEGPNLQRSALKGSTNCTVRYSYIGAARWQKDYLRQSCIG